MDKLDRLLEISVKNEKQKIVRFIKTATTKLNKEGVVFGLSGGIDSTTIAYLTKEVFPDNSIALLLFEKNYNKNEEKDAESIAKKLNLKYEKIDISPVIDKLGKYEILPGFLTSSLFVKTGIKTMKLITKKNVFHGVNPEEMKKKKKTGSSFMGPATVFGMLKWRTRMILLYKYAYLRNYAVLGTTNKTEFSLGHYDPHGDGAVDIECLIHLYKTQVRQLATFLNIPDKIINKKPFPDWLPGLYDEDLMGMSYKEMDRILVFIENKFKDFNKYDLSEKEINEVKDAIYYANFRRSLPLTK